MKNRILRKLCAISLAAVMLTGTAVCSLGAYAASTAGQQLSVTEDQIYVYKDFAYEIVTDGAQNKGIHILRYTGKKDNIVVPSAINGVKVRRIGEEVFTNSVIKSIKIPATVREIDFRFADYCSRLENFYVDEKNRVFRSKDGLLYQGDTLFAVPQAREGELKLPESTKGIKPYAFRGCSKLTQLILGDVDNLSADMFQGCYNLKRIDIGSRTKYISPDFANECLRLEEINIIGEPVEYLSVDGVLFKNSPEATGDKSVPTDLIRYPIARKETGINYKLPDTVTTIWYSAFRDCQYIYGNMEIGKNVNIIMDGAFRRCLISGIKVEKGNKNYRCNNGLLFRSSPYDSKNNFNERKAYVKQGETLVAALYTGKKTIVTPSTVGSIAPYAFYNCRAEMVKIPDGVKYIENNAFEGCRIETLIIPNSVSEIGDEAFMACTDLITATMGAGVEKIGENAFKNCICLENIRIPRKTDEIADNAFDKCVNVTLCVKKDSYAENYAKENKISYTNQAPSLKCLTEYNYIHTAPVQKLQARAKGTDGKGSYEYAFYYKKSYTDNWYRVKDFSAKDTAIISPKQAGSYDIMVKVKDTKTGKTAERIMAGIIVQEEYF